MTTTTAIVTTHAGGSGAHAAGRFWLRHAGYGLALGAAIAFLELAYYYPLLSTSAKADIGVTASVLLVWCGESVLFALVVGFFEQREAPRLLSVPRLVLAVVVGSIAGVSAWQLFAQLILRERFGLWLLLDYVGQPVSLAGVVVYNVWLMLMFGGLMAALHVSRQRHARTMAVLREAELAREDSQRRLADARLAALQARIDPEFVFKTLTEFERLYETDPPRADRVLEELIVFLRRVLADIRVNPV